MATTSLEIEPASKWQTHRYAVSMAGPLIIWLFIWKRCRIRRISVCESPDVDFPVNKAPQNSASTHTVPDDERHGGESLNSNLSSYENDYSSGATNPSGTLVEMPQLSITEQRALEDLRANLSSLGMLERLDPYAQVQEQGLEIRL